MRWSIVLITIAAAATAAPTQWPRPCRSDITRLCRGVANADDRDILSCLVDSDTKLSNGCRKLLQSYGHVPAPAPRK